MEPEYLEPDVDGELLIHVTELPRFISVMVKGAELQVIFDETTVGEFFD